MNTADPRCSADLSVACYSLCVWIAIPLLLLNKLVCVCLSLPLCLGQYFLPFDLFLGKFSVGVFLSPREVFPGPGPSHLPWSRLMDRRGTCDNPVNASLPIPHFPTSWLSEWRMDTPSLKGCQPYSRSPLCSTCAVYFNVTESLRVNRGSPGQV